jgi:glycerol-1-phosphate dehydrogenase [NAD(P)+]
MSERDRAPSEQRAQGEREGPQRERGLGPQRKREALPLGQATGAVRPAATPGGPAEERARQASTKTRVLRVPRVLDVSRANMARISAILQRAGFPLHRVLLVSGGGFTRRCAERIADGLTEAGARVHVRPVTVASHGQAARVTGEAAELAVDLLVGIGGGRAIDVAKTAALACEVDVVTVPTSITHDGISSPVASLCDDAGMRSSVPAAMPAGVIIDIDVVEAAPPAMLRAGVGDLLSNLSAIEDWRLADARGRDTYDAYSALIADGAARPVLALDGLARPGRIEVLAKGLVLSGLAMVTAGTSRPCSGAEHLISHSLDRLLGGTARLHGEQVALGTLVSTVARGAPAEEFRAAFRRCGVPTHPADLGLPVELMVEAVMRAPATRPNRYTILDEVDLSRSAVAELLARAFAA